MPRCDSIGVIVLANTANEKFHEMTIECINSIHKSKPRGVTLQIIVVESNQKTEEKKELFPYSRLGKDVRVENLFQKSFNFNKAVRHGLSILENVDCILVSNNDVIYSDNCLSQMVECIKLGAYSTSVSQKKSDSENSFVSGWDIGHNFFGWSYMFSREVLPLVSIDELFPLELEFWYQDNQYIDTLRRHNLRHTTSSLAFAEHLVEQSHSLLQSEELVRKTTGSVDIYYNLKSKFSANINTYRKEKLLTVAIAGLTKRIDESRNLIQKLSSQAEGFDVEILAITDNKTMTVGAKRDLMIRHASGKYISFVDDDDDVSDDYVKDIVEAIAKHDVDCITFDTAVYIDGEFSKICKYSIDYNHEDLHNEYRRKPNHICCIKTDIARSVRHKDMTWGEDNIWSFDLCEKIKSEHRIGKTLYRYNYDSKKTETSLNLENKIEVSYATQEQLKMAREKAKQVSQVSTGNICVQDRPANRALKIAVYSICKNESKNIKRYLDSIKDADHILVLDTGSTDDSIELLRKYGGPNLRVEQGTIIPWRFDVARNTALMLLPKDIDVCVKLDIDETMDPGWIEAIEESWQPDTTRIHYWFNYDEGYKYQASWIHSRHGYVWRHPAHEVLHNTLPQVDAYKLDGKLSTTHHRDLCKPRNYLEMLKSAVIEDRCSRNLYYLGREYFYGSMHEDAIKTLEEYLTHKGTWDAERCSACCMIGESHFALAKHGESEEAYQRGIKERPSSREPLVRLSMLYYKTGRPELGAAFALKTISITNKPGDVFDTNMAWGETPYDLAAICFHDMGIKEKTIEYWLKAVKLNPRNKRILESLKIVSGKEQDDILRESELVTL